MATYGYHVLRDQSKEWLRQLSIRYILCFEFGISYRVLQYRHSFGGISQERRNPSKAQRQAEPGSSDPAHRWIQSGRQFCRSLYLLLLCGFIVSAIVFHSFFIASWMWLDVGKYFVEFRRKLEFYIECESRSLLCWPSISVNAFNAFFGKHLPSRVFVRIKICACQRRPAHLK